MEGQIFRLLAIYLLYYGIIPGLIIFILFKIKKKKDFIKGSNIFSDRQTDRSQARIEKNSKDLRNLQVLLIVLLLVSMPVLNFASHGLQDISIRRHRSYASWETRFPAYIDRVGEKIGPSSDIDGVIDSLDESSTDWYLDDIREQIDMYDLSRIPGRITFYQLRETMSEHERIVITYSYLSPIPITRSMEFIVIERTAFLEEDTTIVYPIPPSLGVP